MAIIGTILGALGGPIGGIINGVLKRVLPPEKMSDKEREELSNELCASVLGKVSEVLQAQLQVILAEVQGHWLQRNWRPMLMLSIMAIIVNNYIVYPYLTLFGIPAAVLELPEKMWSLLTLGVSGYVVGRSIEKIAETKWGNGK